MVDQNSNQDIGRQEQSARTEAERRRNPADNLTREARIRGGERSAKMQQRDARGQFSGRRKETEQARGEANPPNAGRNAGEP
jgi:hypothetical protein